MLFTDRVRAARLTCGSERDGAWPAGVPAGATAALGVFVLAVVGSLGWHLAAQDATGPVVKLAVGVLYCLLLLAGAVLLVTVRGTGPASLGWAPLLPPHRPWAGLLLPALGVLAAYLLAGRYTGALPPPPPLPVPFGTAALQVLHAATLVPLAEETLFRGLLLGGSLRRWAPSGELLPTVAAIVVNGGLSALLHAAGGSPPMSGAVQWFVVAVACSYLAVRDGDLVRAVTAHSLVSTNAAIAEHF